MHKKLAADLTSLAHSILQMKNKDDVFALQKKAHEVYEKLSVLAYVEEYIRTTPNAEQSKEELIEIIENAAPIVEDPIEEVVFEPEVDESIVVHNLEESVDTAEEEEEKVDEVVEEVEEVVEEAEENIEDALEETIEATEEIVVEVIEDGVEEVEEKIEEVIEEVVETIEEQVQETIEFIDEDLLGKSNQSDEEEKVASLDEELKDTIAVDVVADLFETAPKKSLNDKLHGDIQIGLNDRIAFVKNLFDGSQEDFNRVVSQLNTFKTEKEAKKFITKMVKPDYNWSEKEEFEERFMAIVERKFA